MWYHINNRWVNLPILVLFTLNRAPIPLSRVEIDICPYKLNAHLPQTEENEKLQTVHTKTRVFREARKRKNHRKYKKIGETMNAITNIIRKDPPPYFANI